METSELVQHVKERYAELAGASRELVALYRRAAEQLAAGQAEAASVLATDQIALLAAMEHCQEGLVPFRQALASRFGYADLTLGSLSGDGEAPAALRPVREAMQAVADLLQEAADVLAANQRLLDAQLAAVREKRSALQRGKSARQAYQPAAEETSRFLDLRR